MQKEKGWQNTLKTSGKVLAFALTLAFLIEFFGAKGFYGFLIIIFGMAAFRAIKMRKNMLLSLKYIESMIWKKPLDKNLWKKHELKNTKIKVVWRKKNEKKV